MVAVRVIGCGNPDAGDDAGGLIAVRALRRSLAGVPGIDVVEAFTGFDVLGLLDGAEAAIVVDAVGAQPGVRPGTPLRVQVGGDDAPSWLASTLSSHGIGLGESFALAAALGRLPRTVFLGLTVANVDLGTPLSAEVAAAMPAFVRLVESEVRRMLVGAEVAR